MKRTKNWIIVIALTAAAGLVVVQTNFSPAADNATRTAINGTVTPSVNITDTPTVSEIPSTDTSSYEGCAYVWAYHDAPDISAKVGASIQALNPDASGNASLYGEDCVYADGHATFGAMETDFHVNLPVTDLSAEEDFGNWMAQVMSAITQIPRAEIQGSFGYVEFTFAKSDTESTIVRVPIQDYLDQGVGKTGVNLFRMYSQ